MQESGKSCILMEQIFHTFGKNDHFPFQLLYYTISFKMFHIQGKKISDDNENMMSEAFFSSFFPI